jgi:RHH-type proline utilization regulon transcriptional repressor/proline dehydrogenase/delta 1-pyrroline-5-carboxylate dehydrogenase
VQAYQKRAPRVITYVEGLAERLDRRFMVRLVKGAYWDTEIKRAQERGLSGFPVFTRKAATDLCYLDCARQLLRARDRLYPQFATHNALTLATIVELGGTEGYEFQRLHGMGEVLYGARSLRELGVPVRIYAPVGGHRDLLAYLVRRLLENAANSSFVAQVADEDVTDDELLTHPQDILRPLIERGEDALHPRIRLPGDLYPGRRNSRGAELGHQPDLTALLSAVRRFEGGGLPVQSLVPGSDAGASGERRDSLNPATGEPVCDWVVASDAAVEAAVGRAREAFPAWNAAGPHARAQLLRRYADVLELHRSRLIGVLVAEAGKTVDDALLEVREAVDFCRYYAGEAERIMLPQALPGPVGETNTYMLEGRGVFACIAPWNFPLAIFLGQAVAALAAGNTVVAKPAEQTPLTASVAVGLMKEAGFPEGVLCTVLGGGAVGAKLISDPRLAGVAFTGSTGTAKAIGRTLAEGDGPILPFIAETGGINAMVVDSTALPEQVADDVVASAFRSAGQRCSALRVLYLQDDVADRMIEMIVGAAKALSVGDPSDPDTDLGPVIDEAARERLERHWAEVSSRGTVLYEGGPLPKEGIFFSPRIVEMDAFDAVREEAFGPILHVVRYGSEELEEVMASIAGTGYGLTFGLHSRLDFRAEALTSSAPAGNVYVNRSMTGAVVGVQPFGGRGLSGTGPKAGGPLYLTRFCEERTVTVNTAAAGGNASLIALSED